jgi:hypothetical protein
MVQDLSGLEAQADHDTDNDLDLTAEELHKHDSMELVKQKFLDGHILNRFKDDVPLKAKFQILRTRFKAPCASNPETP